MTKDFVKYSVVIPTFNGASTLHELVSRLNSVMEQTDGTYEIIFIDDDSPDNSWEILTRLKDNYPSIRAFRLMNNMGQFRALMCGFEQVRGEYVITMDDDLQNPPEEIPKLIQCLQQNPHMDAVIAAYENKQHNIGRRVGSYLIDLTNCLISRKRSNLRTTSFRLMRRNMVDAISSHKTMNPVMGPLVIQNSKRIMNVTVEHHPRKSGRSNYRFAGLIKLTLDHILNFSTLPLKIVSVMGILSSCASLLLALYYMVKFLTGDVGVKVQGWTTLILLLIFYSGLILFSLGLIGEYLIRIIREVSHSPRYIIRETL
jgi:polyisoprenyl-phosphate glycosyltransferase